MATQNKIYVQVNDEKIELVGEAKTQFLAELETKALLKAEVEAKKDARDSAIKKLGEIAGLTKEELNAIL